MRSLPLADLMERLYPPDERRLHSLMIELTYRCNFGCRHCFCRLPQDDPTPRPEFSLAQWDRVIGEAADMGALFAVVSGGEPLLRADWRELWLALRRRGILAELFTNASLLTHDDVDFLADHSPSQVSVTVYAATEATHRVMTAREGMLDQVLRNLDLVAEHGLRIEAKSVLTRQNVHEIEALREICLRYSNVFKWDAELTGCYPEGGGHPDAERLTPEEIVALELADPVRVAETREAYAVWRPARPSDTLFRCRVARSETSVDPYGVAHACMLLKATAVDLATTSLRDAWEAMPGLVERVATGDSRCLTCPYPTICRSCPAQSLLSGLPAEEPREFLCRLGHLRAEAFGLSPGQAAD